MSLHDLARRSVPRTLFLAALAALAGCHVTADPPQRYVEVLYPGTLEDAQPVDVVVAPILNTAVDPSLPAEALRQAFVDGLVKRRYSPLALEYVDRQVIEAAYAPGALSEDAVLQVEVRSWDTRRFQSHGVLSVEIEAWMLDASQPGRAELWGARISRTLDLSQEMARYANSRILFEAVSGWVADDLLEAMPARNPAP